MSYKITCYFTDEDISSTNIYGANGAYDYTGYYGDAYKEVGGFSAKTIFTAFPANGCTFTRWVYRLGSTDNDQQFSYSNPFTYFGSQDIYIRAEGEIDEPEQQTWSASEVEEISYVPKGYHLHFRASKYIVYKYRVSFDNSGIATFYTKGSGNTYGYLSKTTSFNNDSGKPVSASTSDAVDNGTDFRFTYNVKKVAHYYLWVRFSDGDRSGNIDLYIDPPEALPTVEPWSWEASNGSATSAQTIKAYQAVTNKTAVSDFSYLVWNDMVDKVKEILDTLGWDWDSLYATYAKTRISSSDKTLTAAKFNSLRYNIGSHYSTGIYEVSPGDEVLGSYFITLTSCINSWIEQDLSG